MHKFTVINFFIGAAVAVILSVLMILGLRIFIPPPEYPSNLYSPVEPCAVGDSICFEKQQARQLEFNDKQAKFNETMKVYGSRIFIGANVVGLAVLIFALIFFALKWGTNIAAGMIISATIVIFYGYTLGWRGTDDKLKFLVGLVVAAILVAGGIIVNRMRDRAALAVSNRQSEKPPGAGAL